MKLSIKIFMFMLFMLTLLCLLPINADYDIINNYRKTEFNSSKFIQSYHNCTLNTTVGLFYLNESDIALVYEDFTTWIESDGSNRLTQTTTRSTFSGLNRIDDSIFLYTTKTGELQNFQATFRFKITQIDNSATTIRMNPLTVTDTLNDYNDNKGSSKPQFGIQLRSWSSSTQYNLLLYETSGTTLYISGHTSNRLSLNVLYYVRLTKTGTALNLLVDNNDDFSSPINDYDLTLHSNLNLPYLMVPQSIYLSGSLQTWGYAEYLDFGETTGGYEDKGVIYTKDLLENTTLKSLIIGMNSTATTSTRIRMYTSLDNSSWLLIIDNNGLGEKQLYKEILNDYSSLYVRFNLTTVDKSKTPYLDELFYSHIDNSTTVINNIVYVNPTETEIKLSSIMIILIVIAFIIALLMVLNH